MQNNSSEANTIQCSNECGFFGNPMTNNMCSKCWRDFQISSDPLVRTLLSGSSRRISIPIEDVTTEPCTIPIRRVATSVIIDGSGDGPVEIPIKFIKSEKTENNGENEVTKSTPLKSSCYKCSKKVGLTIIKCRCGHSFCGKCRYPDSHQCNYDYKLNERKQLEKNNPKISGNKNYEKV